MIDIRTGSAPKIQKEPQGVRPPPPRPPIGGAMAPGMAASPAQPAMSMAAAGKPKKRTLTTGQGHATSMAPAAPQPTLPASPFGQPPAAGAQQAAPAPQQPAPAPAAPTLPASPFGAGPSTTALASASAPQIAVGEPQPTGGTPQIPVPGAAGGGVNPGSGYNDLLTSGEDVIHAGIERSRADSNRAMDEYYASRGLHGGSSVEEVGHERERARLREEEAGQLYELKRFAVGASQFDRQLAQQGQQFDAEMALRNRTLDLQKQGMDADQAYRQAQWELQRWQISKGFELGALGLYGQYGSGNSSIRPPGSGLPMPNWNGGAGGSATPTTGGANYSLSPSPFGSAPSVGQAPMENFPVLRSEDDPMLDYARAYQYLT